MLPQPADAVIGTTLSAPGVTDDASRSVPGPIPRGHRRPYADDVRWWERVSRWDDERRLAVDSVLAVGALLLLVPSTAALPPAVGQVGLAPHWLPPLVATAMCVAIAFRRTHPTRSAVAVYALALLHMLAGAYLVMPADLLVLVALYSVTVHGPTWAYRTAIGATFAGVLIFGLLGLMLGTTDMIGMLVGCVLMGLVALVVFAFALVRRARRTTMDALRERARRLEVERDQLGRIATAAERARIAREMHDIVAHSLSVIIAQADGGRYAAAHDAAAAERSLGTIAETGRAALADMRRLLGVLRDDGGTRPPADDGTAATRPAADGGAPDGGASGGGEVGGGLRPQPGAEDLDQLVAQVRDSGLAVSLVRMGTPRTLPPGTGLAVYRIAQESLTNVLKHGGPDVHVTVLVRWAPDALVLEVSDDGRGAAADSDGQGQGLLGMHERAAMLGGTLTAGPRPGGGYRVRATIPLPYQAAPAPAPGASAAGAPAPGPGAGATGTPAPAVAPPTWSPAHARTPSSTEPAGTPSSAGPVPARGRRPTSPDHRTTGHDEQETP